MKYTFSRWNVATFSCVLLLLIVTAPEIASAQDSEPTVGVQGGRFGVGFTSSWPSYGLSGTLQVNEKITAEAILGFFGTVSNFGGRVWYRFMPDVVYDIYGYGAASMYRYDYIFDTESVLGIGGGAGIEANLGKLFNQEDFPPLFMNWEIGLAFADFKYYNFSSFVFGAGVHYRFGERK